MATVFYRISPLLSVSMLGLFLVAGCNQATLPGYQRCPDSKEFPHLSCCTKKEFFSKESGGCAIPENIRPRQPQQPSAPLNLPNAAQTPVLKETPLPIETTADLASQGLEGPQAAPTVKPEPSTGTSVLKRLVCLAVNGLTIAFPGNRIADECMMSPRAVASP